MASAGRAAADARRAIPRAALVAVIAASACTAPLGAVAGLTVTGDRLLGLAAVGAVLALALARRLCWTPLHTALAIFTAVQVLTSAAAASGWPAGPRLSLLYGLGFACFALSAALAARAACAWDGARAWIAVGAVLGALGSVLAALANRRQAALWGTGASDHIVAWSGARHVLYAANVTFGEWNLYSSFLVVAFALALWAWRLDGDRPWRRSGFVPLAAIAFGLVFGATRAAWIGMAALVGLWAWSRRPGRRAVAALAAAVATALALQALTVGNTPLYTRLLRPIEMRRDINLEIRSRINRATIASWWSAAAPPAARWATRLFGKGAGSINGLPPVPGVIDPKMWNGNMTLFALHDGGLVGLASLAGVVVTAAWSVARALGHAGGASQRPLLVASVGAGAVLLFAYQFTHALWLMYPYVYLGLLAAALTEHRAGGADPPAA